MATLDERSIPKSTFLNRGFWSAYANVTSRIEKKISPYNFYNKFSWTPLTPRRRAFSPEVTKLGGVTGVARGAMIATIAIKYIILVFFFNIIVINIVKNIKSW